MLVLDVPKTDWLRRLAGRNGVSPGPGESVVVRHENAGPWEPAVREIVSYQQLSDDWDGYGAEAPTRDVLESAIGLAYCLRDDGVVPPQRVAPGVAGSVIFEWQDADGTCATVEVDAPLHADVLVMAPGKAAQQWTLPSE